MKRRDFVSKLGVGSAALMSVSGAAAAAGHKSDHDHDEGLSGPLATATVSFGAWPVGGDTPLNRLVTPTAPVAPNVHQQIPYTATIKEGGTVNFNIAGGHLIAIYGPGVKFDDVDGTILGTLPGAPPAFPQYVNDPAGRVYVGANLFGAPQDRVEAVQFPKRGLYLVVCAFVPHFADRMHGWVRVLK